MGKLSINLPQTIVMPFTRSYCLLFALLISFFFTGCYPWRSHSLEHVTEAENNVKEAKQTGKLDSKVLGDAIKAYHFFIMYYPYDTLTPGFIYREGELYQMDGDYTKAVSTLGNLEKFYPKSWQVPDAIFLMANIEEQNIKNQDFADTLYAKLLFNYPDSKAAQKTHQIIESKGISSENFYKKYSKAFLKTNADSTQQSVRYHAYWKKQ